MTDDPTPTTARRQLGAQIRQLRQDRGKTAQQLGDDLGFSVSKISRMESGARAVSQDDIVALTRYFDVSGAQASELIEIARSARRRRNPSPYVVAPEADHLKFVRSGFVELERDAYRIREFNSGLVPGLLQCVGYMRAIMEDFAPGDSETMTAAIDVRLRRQRRLERGPGRYSAVIDEAVLARVVGGPGTMKEQAELLLRRMDDEAVDLRVISFDAGVHPGLNSVFVALTMEDDTGVPDTVFIEGLVGHQSIDRAEDVERFERTWWQLHRTALSAGDSRDLIERYRSRYALHR